MYGNQEDLVGNLEDEDQNMKKFRSLINRLTAEKYERLSKRILEIEIDSYKCMDSLTKLFFEKMVDEKEFRTIYIKLLNQLKIGK